MTILKIVFLRIQNLPNNNRNLHFKLQVKNKINLPLHFLNLLTSGLHHLNKLTHNRMYLLILAILVSTNQVNSHKKFNQVHLMMKFNSQINKQIKEIWILSRLHKNPLNNNKTYWILWMIHLLNHNNHNNHNSHKVILLVTQWDKKKKKRIYWIYLMMMIPNKGNSNTSNLKDNSISSK